MQKVETFYGPNGTERHDYQVGTKSVSYLTVMTLLNNKRIELEGEFNFPHTDYPGGWFVHSYKSK